MKRGTQTAGMARGTLQVVGMEDFAGQYIHAAQLDQTEQERIARQDALFHLMKATKECKEMVGENIEAARLSILYSLRLATSDIITEWSLEGDDKHVD